MSSSLHLRPKIMLAMMKMTEINSEMTEKLCPNLDIFDKKFSATNIPSTVLDEELENILARSIQ